jgi:hypothetical protein
MKRETQRAAAHILRNKSTAWLARASPRSGARGQSTDRKRCRNRRLQEENWAKKFRPTFSLLHVFADGFSPAAIRNVHLFDPPRVPPAGHIAALLL